VDVLTVGAHMGDEVAYGLALAAHRRLGHSIGMLHVTPGEKGHASMLPEDYARQKRQESQACAEVLGAEWWALDYRDGEVPVHDDIKFQVADVIRAAQPKVIVTHWGGSMHKDHTAVHEMLSDCLFYAALPAFKREFPHHRVSRVLYGENWEDLRGYVPELYQEVTREDMDLYLRAMRCYALFRGEVAKFPYLDYYQALARTRGCEVGSELAVTYAVPPESRRRRVQSLLP
jgi:N-acetylglucosamine malate deacetylase 1